MRANSQFLYMYIINEVKGKIIPLSVKLIVYLHSES